MAQSRLEKIGTIFSRLQGLRKSGAIKAEQVNLILWHGWFSCPNCRCPYGPKFTRHFHPDMSLVGTPRTQWFLLGKYCTEKIAYELNIARWSLQCLFMCTLHMYIWAIIPWENFSSLVFKVFGDNERIDLFSDSKLGSERFVQKFMAIHDGGEVAPEQV